MQVDADTILKAALQLPEADRAVLIGRLLEATPETDLTVSIDDPNLAAEFDRRRSDVERTVLGGAVNLPTVYFQRVAAEEYRRGA